jgi:hypothetical protein
LRENCHVSLESGSVILILRNAILSTVKLHNFGNAEKYAVVIFLMYPYVLQGLGYLSSRKPKENLIIILAGIEMALQNNMKYYIIYIYIFIINPHDATPQKTASFIVAAVKTSNPT